MQRRTVTVQEPLVYFYHSIPPNEDRSSTWLSDALHFKFKTHIYAKAIEPVLRNKIIHTSECPLEDHSSCNILKSSTAL
jgi:hypothetical protein